MVPVPGWMAGPNRGQRGTDNIGVLGTKIDNHVAKIRKIMKKS
jgi:hypothetical protein